MQNEKHTNLDNNFFDDDHDSNSIRYVWRPEPDKRKLFDVDTRNQLQQLHIQSIYASRQPRTIRRINADKRQHILFQFFAAKRRLHRETMRWNNERGNSKIRGR